MKNIILIRIKKRYLLKIKVLYEYWEIEKDK